MSINHARLKELSTQLETETGKVCVYALWADAGLRDCRVEYEAIARQMGLKESVVEERIINDPTGDYGFLLVPQEVNDWDEDWDDEGAVWEDEL